MNGLDYIKSVLNERYAYLVSYRKLDKIAAKSIVSNILEDLTLCYTKGLSVRPVYMNPNGVATFIDVRDIEPDYEYYSCIVSSSKTIPEIEHNEDGIIQVYDDYDDAMQVLKWYNEYFRTDAMGITGF